MISSCSIEGCQKPVLARCMCSRHYTRWWKYGDPMTRLIASKGEALLFLQNAKAHADDGCLLWPFKSRYATGYGSVWFEGGLTGAHRAMCIMAHGPAPEGMEAAHSCGIRLCVNPNHLRWATAAENAADKAAHGRNCIGSSNTQAKLTEADVRSILTYAGSDVPHSVVARKFGVSRRTIGMILSRQTWRHIEGAAA